MQYSEGVSFDMKKCSDFCEYAQEVENQERAGKWIKCTLINILVPDRENYYCYRKEGEDTT